MDACAEAPLLRSFASPKSILGRSLLIVALALSCASLGFAQDESPSPDVSDTAAAVAESPDAAAPADTAAPGNAADGDANNGEQQAQPRGMSPFAMIMLWGGLFLIWYLMVIRPSSNQRAKRDDLLKNLKKNDKVVTTGGIVGTVSNVHETTGEVTIRSGDTPLRILREAVREVIEDSNKESSSG